LTILKLKEKATIFTGKSSVKTAKHTKNKPEMLEQEFAFFRHCELIRAQKGEDGKIYFTKWQH
jgi:hypothetical protein